MSEVLNQLNTEQKLWLSGFLAGQATDLPLKTLNSELSQTEINTEYRLTILYGSQTGNAKLLAENYLLEAKSQNRR